MLKLYTSLLLSALPIVATCKPMKLNPEPVIHFSESLGADYFFLDIAATVINPEGMIYILDRGANQVLKFDMQGQLITKFGRDGQGPLEFKKPSDLIYINNQLWVADQMNGRIQIYKDDTYFKTVKLLNPTHPKSLVHIDDSVYVASQFYVSGHSAIAKLNADAELVETLNRIEVPAAPYKNTRGLWRGVQLVGLAPDQLLFGFHFDSLIVTASTTGKTLRQQEMTDFYQAEEEKRGALVTPKGYLVSRFASGPDGTLLLTICEGDAKSCGVIYQLDARFKTILNKWDLGETIWSLDYDQSKNLLVTASRTELKIYAVEFANTPALGSITSSASSR